MSPPHALWAVSERNPVNTIENGCQVMAGQHGDLTIRTKCLISLEEHISAQPEHSKFEIIELISADTVFHLLRDWKAFLSLYFIFIITIFHWLSGIRSHEFPCGRIKMSVFD